MVTKALVEHFLLHEVTLLVTKHPVSKLAVPNETVTTHWNLVATAPVSDAISFLPSPFTLIWMKLTWFHVVFAGNAVVVLEDYFLLCL